MALIEPAKPRKQEDRRRFSRVVVRLPGRFMLPDRTEHPCTTVDMSPGGVALKSEARPELETKVVCYLDQVGRVEGSVTRRLDDGFCMTIGATVRKREKLAAQLMWLANRHTLGLPEDRRHERIIPTNPFTIMLMQDGATHSVRLMDISQSGAAVSCSVPPQIGLPVVLGKTRARVVRPLEGGFAVEFARPIASHDLDIDTVL